MRKGHTFRIFQRTLHLTVHTSVLIYSFGHSLFIVATEGVFTGPFPRQPQPPLLLPAPSFRGHPWNSPPSFSCGFAEQFGLSGSCSQMHGVLGRQQQRCVSGILSLRKASGYAHPSPISQYMFFLLFGFSNLFLFLHSTSFALSVRDYQILLQFIRLQPHILLI